MKRSASFAFALAAFVAVPGILFAQSTSSSSSSTTTQTSSGSSSQTSGEVGEADANRIGPDTAQQELKEISVDKFESAGFWSCYISADEGWIQGRLFEGAPSGKTQIEDEKNAGMDPKETDKYVFGARTDFYHRGYNEIYILAQRPIPVEGITKTLSVWVAGRNYNHTLKVIIEDFNGVRYELPMGNLNFQGWKQLSVSIPPQNVGSGGIVQRDFHYATHMGLKVIGFKIECSPMEAYGTYYVYFDDLRAMTDLFAEDPKNKDPDDMADNW